MSLTSIDLFETDGLLLFRSKSTIFQTIDLERVIEKAKNIFNFYLDFNWESRFIEDKVKHFCQYALAGGMECGQSQLAPLKLRSLALAMWPLPHIETIIARKSIGLALPGPPERRFPRCPCIRWANLSGNAGTNDSRLQSFPLGSWH